MTEYDKIFTVYTHELSYLVVTSPDVTINDVWRHERYKFRLNETVTIQNEQGKQRTFVKRSV